jgi:hypothetical protein
MNRTTTIALLAIASFPATAAAQPAGPQPSSGSTQSASPGFSDDGYCDYVEGTAAATAAPLVAPQLFGQFGYIEQPSFAETPGVGTSNLRAIGGLRYSISNLFAASATKSRAAADCKRHKALQGVQSVRVTTTGAALQARMRVYDEAQAEADKLLTQSLADLQERRITAPEATSTRLRVEELRSLAADVRRQLAALPPGEQRPLTSIFTSYRDAESAMEKSEARLRNVSAYDVSVRFGVDQFLEGDTSTRFFGVVQVGINLGTLWMGSGNSRSAAGRKRYAATAEDRYRIDVVVDEIRATLEVETKRVGQVQALVTDLTQQWQSLASIQGQDSQRFRETVWFELVKAKGELAYLQTHVQTMQQMLGESAR